MKKIVSLLTLLVLGALPVPLDATDHLIYKANKSVAKNKHLVLIGDDHEYRSEETIPALARILAERHGFDCTVLFGLDPETGTIVAGQSNIPGLEALKSADGLVLFARFLALPDEQMKHIDDYLKRGGPVVALRTSTHAFNYPKDTKSAFAKYHFQYKGDDYNLGFGHQVLGQTWVGHYGKNHQQSTRISIIPKQSGNPILRGVKDIWVQAGGYNAEPADDWTILTMAQPLLSMEQDGKPDPEKEPKASEWTRHYTAADGKKARVFTSLYGASEDILNDGYRRMILNAVYWSLGLEDSIKADAPIGFVGPYKPTTFSGKTGAVPGVKPSDYSDLKSTIPGQRKAKSANKDDVTKNGAAKFVRISIPGKGRILTLTEVEILNKGGKNIAVGGKTSQSSVSAGGVPERAIDGNKDSDFNKKGQTHTAQGGNVKDPWWEIELKKDSEISSIKIWNRAGFAQRLEGFTLEVLDAKRKPIFVRTNNPGADGSISFDLAAGGTLATADHKGRVMKVKEPLKPVPADYRDPANFTFQKGDHISIVGNTLAERLQHEGWMETLLQSQHPDLELVFRNLGISGDQVDNRPRSKDFTTPEEFLEHGKADVIFSFFGYNESFENKPDEYTKKLSAMIDEYRALRPNGKSIPRIVLFSPIAHENLKDKNLPNGNANNKRLAAYTTATEKVASDKGVTFVNLFTATKKAYGASDKPLTANGIHLNPEGNRQLAEVIASTLLKKEVKADKQLEAVREAVIDKNWYWYMRYRAIDGNDIWGSRADLKFVEDQTNRVVLVHELAQLDVMTANRDPRIWMRSRGSDVEIDDSNVPKAVPVVSNVGGGSKSSNAEKEGSLKYISGKDGLGKITVPEGFEVNLFADEKQFPELVNPVQMQVDGKGRVWAAAWTTYPKWQPGKEMDDALLILPDEDGDGKADRVIEFARVHSPLGFEFWNGGVIVASQPDIIFLKDTDGDDIADYKEILVHGIGSADTHHAANNFIHGPDGAIYWQSGIFMINNIEHPWGPSLTSGASAMYRFDPRQFTISQHAGNSPNPHGITFDRWGYHYANDGTGGRSYQVRPSGSSFQMHKLLEKEVRPVAADAIVSSANFPDDMQGNFLVCNTIGYLGIKQYKLDRDGGVKFTETTGRGKDKKTVEKTTKFGEVWGTPTDELLFSADKNFRPTDAVFGQDGALYVSDWSNVIIGHMQHNVRDPNRDHQHGRIYRMIAKDRPLQKPVKIDGASLPELMVNLEHPVDGVRHRTRVELSERNSEEVIAACQKWIGKFDAKSKADAHHFLEALWVHQQHNRRNNKLLQISLQSPEPHARVAAQTVQHHWFNVDYKSGGDLGGGEDLHGPTEKSGVLSDTPELTTIRIGTLIERMRYDLKEFTVKAGKKLSVTFDNPDFLPHNLVFTQPNSADAVAQAALAMGAEGFAKGFVPQDDRIIIATKMLDHKQDQILEFNAPTKPGNYEFVCTFPGHNMLMKGVMKVVK